MFGCVSCAGPAVLSLGSSRIQRAAVKQSENRQRAGAAPSAARGHPGMPPSPSSGWDRPLGKQGKELRALGRWVWDGGADRVGSGVGWYPQGCAQVTVAARGMQLGCSDKTR